MTREIKYDKETLRQILDDDSQAKLVLPDFQRDFVWDRDKQTKLIASVLVGLPIGAVLIVNGQKDNFIARSLGSVGQVNPREDCRYLLDGQQRLSCLKSVFSDPFPFDTWRGSWQNLFGRLRKRWFLKIKPSLGSVDLWGYEELKFKNELKEFDPSQVEEFIIAYEIDDVRSKSGKWYHPAYSLQESNAEVTAINRRRVLLARKFAQEYAVPLFDTYSRSGEDSLHWKTLENIANTKQEELEADIKDGKISLESIFGSEIVEELPTEEAARNRKLDSLWATLASKWVTGVSSAIEGLLSTEITETILSSDEIDRAVAIFEAMNLGGTPLSTFDLIVAKAARVGDKSLSDLLKEFIEQEIDISTALYSVGGRWKLSYMGGIENNSINKSVSDQFLNLVSVLSYEEALEQGIDGVKVEHTKRKKILELKPDQVNKNSERAVSALVKAFAFLQYRCGIVDVADLSYELMLLPIAYLFSNHNSEQTTDCESSNDATALENLAWKSKKALDKIEYWYWLSLLSGRYKENQNQRCIEDIQSLSAWILTDSENPFSNSFENVLDRSDYSNEEILLLENSELLPPKAIREGLLQYTLSLEPKDFLFPDSGTSSSTVPKLKAWEIARTGKKLDKHHIIPLGSVTKVGETSSLIRDNPRHSLNSPLNFTYISNEANVKISDTSPQLYLNSLTDLTVTNHTVSDLLPDLRLRQLSTFDESFYKELLRKRFNALKTKIRSELESLLDED